MTHARGIRLFYGRMSTVLGLLGVALFIPSVIALAASVTWVVVRFSPGTKGEKDEKPSPNST
jgi:hypothetical protein